MSERFLARANLDRHTGLKVLKQVRQVERAGDLHLLEQAKLHAEMLEAGLDHNIDTGRSHAVLASNLDAMVRAFALRESTVEVHRHLAELGHRMGIDLRAEGCSAACPPPVHPAIERGAAAEPALAG